MKFNHTRRIRIISFFIFIFAVILIGRLYVLQIVNKEVYITKADRQYLSVSKNVFDRGTIFFQNKDGNQIPAATLKSGFTIAVNPRQLKDPENVYRRINQIMEVDFETFMTKATKKNDTYEEIANHADEILGAKINALNIAGLKAYKDRWRFYPGGRTASHVIGLLGYKGDDYAGRYGLESQFESQLARKDEAYVNFFAQIFSGLQTAASTSSVLADVVTTIEPTVESVLENILASTTEKWNSDLTGGIIINPQTGEIYAMESYPSFDPNSPKAEKNSSIFSNPLVENVYEMGSIIKPLTISAGIDAGVITASSTYHDKGFVVIDGKKISNFDGKERGIVSMQDVLSQSLNVGATHVESLLGNSRFTDYMRAFGLNEKTSIELPNEGRNLVKNLESGRDIEHATASFGQGIALTPIATVRALATVANGGFLIRPHVVKSLNYKIGISKNTSIETGSRVIKKETSQELSRMLSYSVDHILSGGTLRLPNYSVAAKTGTAQIAKENGGGYYEDKFLHSFIGYFPSYDPKFFIFLFTVNPKGVQFGSETLTRPFMELVKFLINYYDVPPDR